MKEECSICKQEFEPDLFIKTDKNICNSCLLTRLLIELAENDLDIELEEYRAAAMAEVITIAFRLTRNSESHIPDRIIKQPEQKKDLFEILCDITKPGNLQSGKEIDFSKVKY